jgi:cytoskeletal protein RodZ
MMLQYMMAGTLGVFALYVMTTEVKLPKSASASLSQSSSQSKTDSTQSKSTADSAPVVTVPSEIAGIDEGKQEGGPGGEDEEPPKTDDSPAASMKTQPDTEKPKDTKRGMKETVASTKKSVKDSYYGKGDLPPMKREDPSPESDDKDEYRAEGADSKSSDFIGK